LDVYFELSGTGFAEASAALASDEVDGGDDVGGVAVLEAMHFFKETSQDLEAHCTLRLHLEPIFLGVRHRPGPLAQ
jgi:hypothetical protein